jgi:hypothetical protein
MSDNRSNTSGFGREALAMGAHVLSLVAVFTLVPSLASHAAQTTQKSTPGARPTTAARPAAKPSPAATASDLDQIIELVKSGAPDSLVIKTIQTSGKVYKLAPADVLRLKKAGVRDAVIEAMLDSGSQPRTAAAPSSPSAGPATPRPAASESPGDREPTEAEMLAALKAGYDNANAYMKQQEEACRNGSFRTSNDPAQAMLCLAGALGTGGRGGLGVQMTGFRKVACARATNQPGWNCDYVQSTDMTGVVSSPVMKDLMSNNVMHGRFVYTDGRWVKIE